MTSDFYFIKVHARIQVEHPVTELVTGVDFAKGQILIAQGEHIDALIETPVRMRGHLFMPSPGRITGLKLPGGTGIRGDTAVYTDWIVPPHPIRCRPNSSHTVKIAPEESPRCKRLTKLRPDL